jgi:hypothetical protein
MPTNTHSLLCDTLILTGPAFHHPYFIRGDPDSCRLINRGGEEKCSVTLNSSSRPAQTSESRHRPIDSRPALLEKRHRLENKELDQEGHHSLTMDLDEYPPYGATSWSIEQSLLQGGAKVETIGWILSGAVSLPDLNCVLESYSGISISRERAARPQPPRNQNAPFFPEQRRDLSFQEDIISLFGNAKAR